MYVLLGAHLACRVTRCVAPRELEQGRVLLDWGPMWWRHTQKHMKAAPCAYGHLCNRRPGALPCLCSSTAFDNTVSCTLSADADQP
jgi:hypothetical protein